VLPLCGVAPDPKKSARTYTGTGVKWLYFDLRRTHPKRQHEKNRKKIEKNRKKNRKK
jgi:hypothetical protein